jgi:hypothetical protein
MFSIKVSRSRVAAIVRSWKKVCAPILSQHSSGKQWQWGEP